MKAFNMTLFLLALSFPFFANADAWPRRQTGFLARVTRLTLSARYSLVLLFIAVGIGGCSSGKPMATRAVSDGAPRSVKDITCDGDHTGRVAWWTEKVDVSFMGQQWTLPRVMAASGARYSDGKRELWEHQGTLRLTIGPSAPVHCTFTNEEP